MSLMEDFNNGHKAYYEEVPRYKNPWSGCHFDDSNASYWDKGWEVAKEEHRLFTENQGLKEEKADLDRLTTLLDKKIETMCNEVNSLLRIVSVDSQTIINYRNFINKRDDQLDALIDSVGKLNKFTFSREKMVIKLKTILNELHNDLEVISPEVEKRKPK